MLPDLCSLIFISYHPFLLDIKDKMTEKSFWFPQAIFPEFSFLTKSYLFFKLQIFKNSFTYVTARIMTYSCMLFTTNVPVPLWVYGKHAQLITLRFLHRTMALPNIEWEKPAIYIAHAAYEALTSNRTFPRTMLLIHSAPRCKFGMMSRKCWGKINFFMST